MKGGREFDGAIGNRWIQAKSGGYWNNFNWDKFASDFGSYLKIAKDNNASLELHSNTPIPQNVKDWLDKRGIKYFEYLD